MNEELMFTICDIKRQVEKTIKDVEKEITINMNEDNRKGYDYGVKTILDILENIISVGEDDDSILVNKTGLDKSLDFDECDLHDLLEEFGARTVAYRNL